MKTSTMLTLSLLLFLAGCTREKAETTTRGNLHALFAESTAPVMIEEVNQFLGSYSKAGANITYEVVSSEDAIRRMLHDTLRYIVSTRPMSPAERQQLPRVEGFDLNEIVIAYDGIAVVVNPKNVVEKITTVELSKILSGEIRRWEQLSEAETMKGTIEVLYQDSSDVSLFAESRILHGKGLRKDLQKTTSSLATLRSVVERPLSIGLVGVLWVDSAHVSAKVLKVAETRETQDTTFRLPPERMGKFCTPHPANIYRNYYPLKRAIYAYTFGPVASFASGFSTFVATKDGQRIFLDKNVVPATQPIRLKAPE
ncbi:MAG: substrate-binding domain-containing protein [Ignavibacteriales bacterium]|nr:substrate-binding domain-containing protein [Ignavibacteriales bacterium]